MSENANLTLEKIKGKKENRGGEDNKKKYKKKGLFLFGAFSIPLRLSLSLSLIEYS